MTLLPAGQLVYEVRFDADFHTGSGFSEPGGADAVLDRDARGFPRITGTRLKGKALDGARRALAAAGHSDPARDPLLAAVFGSGHDAGASEGRFRFLAAELPKVSNAKAVLPQLVERRSHNKVDPRTGRVAGDFFFSRELARRDLIFLGRVTWDGPVDDRELDLLALALRMIESLGGKTRRGEGACRIELLGVYDGHWSPRDLHEGAPIPDPLLGTGAAPLEGPALIARAVALWEAYRGNAGPGIAFVSPTAVRSTVVPTPGGCRRERWLLRVEPLERLLAGDDRSGGNALRGLDHVPGTQLRGALAARLVRTGLTELAMSHLFGSGGIRVANAYPAAGDAIPVPLSARRSKHDENARLVDVLLRPEDAGRERHPDTDEPLERVKGGFLSVSSTGPVRPVGGRSSPVTSVDREVTARIAIDPQKGRAADQQFWTIDALSPAAQLGFFSAIDAEPGALQGIADALGLKHIGDGSLRPSPFELSIGAVRSAGLGRVRCTLERADESSDLSTRLRAFDDSKVVKDLGLGGKAFTVTLVSDAIVVDKWLRYRGGLHAEDLWDDPALGALVEPYPARAVTATGLARSWHGLAGLPRPDDRTVAKGSAFLFSFMPGVTDEARLKALERLEAEGIGCRRHEGFGRVVVCLAWHYEWAPQR